MLVVLGLDAKYISLIFQNMYDLPCVLKYTQHTCASIIKYVVLYCSCDSSHINALAGRAALANLVSGRIAWGMCMFHALPGFGTNTSHLPNYK